MNSKDFFFYDFVPRAIAPFSGDSTFIKIREKTQSILVPVKKIQKDHMRAKSVASKGLDYGDQVRQANEDEVEEG